jgi:single-strand DNA-binding protein
MATATATRKPQNAQAVQTTQKTATKLKAQPGINLVSLVGRVGQDPELRYFDSGKIVAKMSLAVNRLRRAGEDTPPDWFDLEIWGKTAEIAGEYVRKGSMIGVTGQLSFSRWNDKETGEPRIRTVIRVDNLDLLSRARSQEDDEAQGGEDF